MALEQNKMRTLVNILKILFSPLLHKKLNNLQCVYYLDLISCSLVVNYTQTINNKMGTKYDGAQTIARQLTGQT